MLTSPYKVGGWAEKGQKIAYVIFEWSLNKMYFFCSNQLNLSEYTRLEHKKHSLSPKNCLLEIKACNLEIHFIHIYNTLVS